MFGRKPLTAAITLILVIHVFRGQTQSCHRSEYQIGKECCPMCPAGSRVKTDCTEFKSTSCLPCTEGTYMNRPNGLRQCLSCSVCHAGSGLKIKRTCTTTSDTVCEPLEGFYCTESAEDGCETAEKHTSCSPGQYISQTGTSSRDTECSDCRDGTYSDGTFTSCQPHTQCETKNLQLIKPGTVSTDAECGEQSSHGTGIVVGIVVLIFLISGAAAFSLYYMRKKKTCLFRGGPDNPTVEPLNVKEESEQVSDRCQQQQDNTAGSFVDTPYYQVCSTEHTLCRAAGVQPGSLSHTRYCTETETSLEQLQKGGRRSKDSECIGTSQVHRATERRGVGFKYKRIWKK